MTCARCQDKGTIFHPLDEYGGSGYGEICRDCRVTVNKAELRDLASQMESFVAGNLSVAPIYPDSWATRLRHLVGDPANMTPMVEGKLDAIVDAHDRAEAVSEDIQFFNQKLARALGVSALDKAITIQEEREACAKIADAHTTCFEATANGSSACKSHEAAAHNIAAVIRSRGAKP